MKLRIACLSLIAGAALAAAGSVPSQAATTSRTGTITVTITGAVKSSGLTVSEGTCGLNVGSDDAVIHAETISKSFTVASGKFSCVLTLDYAWEVASTTSTMDVSYVITGISSTGARTSEALVAPAFTIPASGKTTTFSVSSVL